MQKAPLVTTCLAAVALATLACASVRSTPPPPTPTLFLSPTPPAIPTPIPATPTPLPELAGQPAEQAATGETASFLYGSLRDGSFSLYFLSSTGFFAAPLDLGPDVPHAAWPAVSPDGERLTFVSVQPSAAMRSKGIYISTINGSDLRQITFGDGAHPRWSPDGTRLAYTCNDGVDVCIINADGSGEANLTVDSGAVDQHPDWTPDGRIVFMSDRGLTGGRLSEIYIMRADGSDAAPLTQSGSAYNAHPAVSPDGTLIVFESDQDVEIGSELYVMGLDGHDMRRLTVDDVWNQNPVWSPDGQQILYAASDGSGNLDLYSVSATGGAPTRLTENPAEDGGLRLGHTWLPTPRVVPGFSREAQVALTVSLPRGSQPVTNSVLFAANDFNCPDCLETGIYFVSFDGANLVRLPLTGFFPAWDPDFQRIAYTLNGELFVANTDGSEPTQITSAHRGLGAVDWDDRGQFIASDCTPYGQYDVCLIDTRRGTVNNITEEITFGSGLAMPVWRGADLVAGNQIINQEGTVVGNLPASGRLSPDGSRLATILEGQLAVIPLEDDEGEATILTDDSATKGFPVWSPAGDLIIYSLAPGDGRLYLHATRPDGAESYRLVEQPIALGPDGPVSELAIYYGYNWAP